MQAHLAIGQLAFVDQQSRFVLPFLNIFENAVEVHHFVLHVGSEQPKRKKRRGQQTWNRDSLFCQHLRLHRLSGNDDRAVVVPHACAAGEQRVLVGHVGIGVEGDRRNFVLSFEGLAVERLDIVQQMNVVAVAGIDFVRCQRVKHEGVVRIRTVCDMNIHLGLKPTRPFLKSNSWVRREAWS